MTINQLRYFLTIAKYQNFRKASEELFLAQPSLSKAMEKLEEELQVQLFRKEGRGVTLTEEGRTLEIDAKKILEDVDIALQHLQQTKEEREASFTIGSTSLAINGYLPDLISNFLQACDYPVKVNHNLITSYPLEDHLAGGANDMIIGYLPVEKESLVRHLFLREPYVVLVPKQHPLADRSEIDIRELAEEEWLMPGSSSHHYQTILRIFRSAGVTPRIKQYNNLTSVLYSLVNQGNGVAIAPLNPYITQANISVLRIRNCQEAYELHLAYPADKPLKKSAADFVHYVKEHPYY